MMIMLSKHGSPQGVVAPTMYLACEGSGAETPADLDRLAVLAYDALRADRRLRKKKANVVVLVVAAATARVTPVHIRHQRCSRNRYAAGNFVTAWQLLFSEDRLRALAELQLTRYYLEDGEIVIHERADEGRDLLRRCAALAPAFAEVHEAPTQPEGP